MKTNRVIALMIGLLLTFSMTACGEQMSAMNTDMEGKTEAKMEEKMEESSDMMEGKTEEQFISNLFFRLSFFCSFRFRCIFKISYSTSN